MIENGFRRGVIDHNLFIKERGDDIMLVQVYVDDIIFGSTDQKMVDEFQDVMQKRFKMSSLGAINFFLGLQVDQTEKGNFLHQSKYVADILSRFKMEDERIAKNPSSVNHWIRPENTRPKVNPTLYRAIIGSLMYLTASRPYIMFATCLCTRYEAQPNVNHMLAAKKIMRYLKGTPSLGLWYPRTDGFDLTAFSDSDYGGCKRDLKSTSGGCQFLGSRLVNWQCKKQTAVAQSTYEAEYIAAEITTVRIQFAPARLHNFWAGYNHATARLQDGGIRCYYNDLFDNQHLVWWIWVLKTLTVRMNTTAQLQTCNRTVVLATEYYSFLSMANRASHRVSQSETESAITQRINLIAGRAILTGCHVRAQPGFSAYWRGISAGSFLH
ncbi:uncharacterized mitochondrial protein AtMg00810-like [Rutidosis leptorrhynchoides]|uniref:uncharacterized mitochondrial protein AtMg00810-like n=1 Tax=Rutidosis leptorrhynchoides TaxID=125765 RepID=UPI003A99A3EF